MNEQLVTHIEELGLSNKEARVYVANLMLGASSVQRIADQAGIKRVTAYVILESLIGLGLVSQSNKGKKTYFVAEDPNNLQRLLDKRQQELQDQKQNFDQILPELLGLKSVPKESPNVKFYDGAEGIRSVMATFLVTQQREKIETLYGWSNFDQLEAFFPEIKEHSGNPARTKSGIPSKLIYTTSRGPVYKETDKLRNRESRYVPADQFPLNGDLTIAGKHVIMLSLDPHHPIGVTIESAELAKTMMSVFQLSWAAAEQYNK
jgi:HTH-type transcriptional regulator, sugar sensing transcriptional regulator